MDVMDIRRNLLLSIFGGEPTMIGEFSRYEKKKLTFPNASNSNAWASGASVECSFEPKIVIFYGGTDTDYNIISGVYLFNHDNNDKRSGGTLFRNGANLSKSTSGVVPAVENTLPAAAANRCVYAIDTGKVYITRTGSNGYWSNTDEYTFEIYG